MKTGILLRGAAALIVLTATTPGLAVPVAVDTTSAINGITDLYSATFDPALVPCGGSSPPYCSFFGGDPPTVRNIVVTPTPTGAITAVPLGFTPVPASGSYLDLTLNGTNTQVTIAGGTLAFPRLDLTIVGGTPNETIVNAGGAGVVFAAAPQSAALNANGQAEFFVNTSPSAAVDFSSFPVIVGSPNGSCAGSFCALIQILTLDMVRYRLVIDYDPTFTYFTASLIGQTANNSMLFITMNSVAPTTDQSIPFGSVAIGSQLDQTVTVTNAGNADLVLDLVAVADGLIPPFSITSDNCSGQTVQPTFSCTIGVRFEPTVVDTFNDTFDIPSNDPTDPTDTVSVSGTGTVATPDIRVTDDTVPENDLLVPFGNVTEGTTRDRTITVTNVGGLSLVVGAIGGTDPLEAPFSLVTDNCSNQALDPAASCTFITRYAPTGTGPASGSLDIPSNDPDEDPVTVQVTGTGITLGEGGVGTPSPEGTDSGFMAIDPATLLLLGAAGAWGWRRRRIQ